MKEIEYTKQMSDLGLLEGVLKQQCVDENGLYVWLRKTFFIDVSKKILYVRQNEADQPAEVPLHGAKYAKEWSFSSSLAGFGFDLVWTSGKIWSFLVENEQACKKWVEMFNTAVAAKQESGDESSVVSANKPPRYPTLNSKHAAAAASLSATIDQVNAATSTSGNAQYSGDPNETQLDAASPIDVLRQRAYSDTSGGCDAPKTEVKYAVHPSIAATKQGPNASGRLTGIEAALLQSTREAEQSGILPPPHYSSEEDDISGSLPASSLMMQATPHDSVDFSASSTSPPRPPPPHSLLSAPAPAPANAEQKDLVASAPAVSGHQNAVDRITRKIFAGTPAATTFPTSGTSAGTGADGASNAPINASEEVRKAIERAAVQIQQHDSVRADLVGDIYEDPELAREAVAAMKVK